MSMTLETSPEDRFLIFRLMQPAVQCPTCKSGPIDTSDIGKLSTYGKIWDLLQLSDFENLNQVDLLKLFKEAKVTTAEFKSDTLRYTIDLFFTRGYALPSFSVAITFLNKLISLATKNNVKLNNALEESVPINDKTVSLTFEQLQGLALVLTTNRVCKAEFTSQDGQTLIHGALTDSPKSLADFNKLLRILTSLGLLQLMTTNATMEPYTSTLDYSFATSDLSYLKTLVAEHSTIVNFPQHKLAAIINLLD
jgi:hypothetical protein